MIAIFKREFRSYFDNMIGYIVVAVLFFFFALFYVVSNISAGTPIVSYGLFSVVTYLTILVPLLTMRTLAEDRKSKTDQILLTSPVSVFKVIMAKFWATCMVVLIPTAPTFIFSLILKAKGGDYLLTDIVGILAFLLLTFAYIAIGMFISSITESQIIAAILSVVTFFVLNIISVFAQSIPETSQSSLVALIITGIVVTIITYINTRNIVLSECVFFVWEAAVVIAFLINKAWLVGLIQKALMSINIATAISTIPNYQIIDMAGVVKLISVIVFFLFLTVQSLEKRRWN